MNAKEPLLAQTAEMELNWTELSWAKMRCTALNRIELNWIERLRRSGRFACRYRATANTTIVQLLLRKDRERHASVNALPLCLCYHSAKSSSVITLIKNLNLSVFGSQNYLKKSGRKKKQLFTRFTTHRQ